MSIELNKV